MKNVIKTSFSIIFFSIILVSNIKSQCTLSGTYSNTTEFQTALNIAAGSPNNCSVITLSGVANFNGSISVPSGVQLIITGTLTMTAPGSFSTDEDLVVSGSGVFNTNNQPVTVGPTTYTNLGTINTPTTILPVVLTSFIAEMIDNSSISIIWQTATELNNSKFIIETSTQGEVFQRIGEIAGAGTTTEPQNYTFTHHTPSAGVNYYRLKQVDVDGTFEYSKVIAINAPGSNDLFAFPNPTRDKITLQYDQSKGTGNIQLLDALGRRINANIGGYAGNYDIKLPEGLPKGTYWLRVERGGKVQTVPVVKE